MLLNICKALKSDVNSQNQTDESDDGELRDCWQPTVELPEGLKWGCIPFPPLNNSHFKAEQKL